VARGGGEVSAALSTSAPIQQLHRLQPFFHYLNCFSQHLAVKLDAKVLFFKFYRKLLRKAVRIVKKLLKVFIVKRVEGADWVLKVPTGCQHVPPWKIPFLSSSAGIENRKDDFFVFFLDD
jgi:hypothetical protein